MALDVAITLPQLGHAASGPNIRRAAVHAEALGFSDVWVNDHIAAPVVDFKSHTPYMYDPLLSLATAAAVTEVIGIGGQVIVSYYQPVWLANALASLDSLSEGRLKVAIGVGWAKEEFTALGSNFHDRGRRTDEIITILRACWQGGVTSFDGEHYSYPPLRILPQPAHPIPLWASGWGEAAFKRAVAVGDGFHGGATVESDAAMPEMARRLRQERPDRSTFTISAYTHEWDPADVEADVIRRNRDVYEAAGIQHVVVAPNGRDIDSWLRSMEALAAILDIAPR